MGAKTFASVYTAYVSRLRRDGNIPKLHNERGEFEPFKMMIGAIFALMILTIIISAIAAFDQWRLVISKDKFYTGLRNAVKQPNGDQFVINDIFFDKGEGFSANSIAKNIGLNEGCLALDAYPSTTYIFSNTQSNQSLEIRSRVQINVYSCCRTNLNGGNPNCEISCTVSFAKPIAQCIGT